MVTILLGQTADTMTLHLTPGAREIRAISVTLRSLVFVQGINPAKIY
jgi:hypothetical protein